MARIFRFLRILLVELLYRLLYRDPAPLPPLDPRVPYDAEAYGDLLRQLLVALAPPDITGLPTAGDTADPGIPLPPDLATAPDAQALAALLAHWSAGVQPWIEPVRRAVPSPELGRLHRLVSYVAQFQPQAIALGVQAMQATSTGRWAEAQRLRGQQQAAIGYADGFWRRLAMECQRLRVQDPPLWRRLAIDDAAQQVLGV